MSAPMSPEDFAAARRYAMVIEWSDEDQLFLVSVPDLDTALTSGTTREEAARMGEEAIATWLASDARHNLISPEPRFSALREARPRVKQSA